MTKIVTLNELLDLIKTFQQDHPMLNGFGYGPTSEIGTSKKMEFPYLWVTHQSDSYLRVSNKTIIPDLKIVVLFMDQVNNQENVHSINGQDSNNGQEIMSDTFQYMQDLALYIDKNLGAYGIKISEDIRIYPAFDQTTDIVNGWAGEFTLRLTYYNCTIPS